MNRSTFRQQTVATWLVAVVLFTQVATAGVLSKYGAATRSQTLKLTAGLEVTLESAVKKGAWLEALEVIQITLRLEPDNPQASSYKKRAMEAFLADVLRQMATAETKALDRSTAGYSSELEKLLKDAKKKDDVLAIRECVMLLLELDSKDRKLAALKKKVDLAADKLAPDKLALSKLQEAARRARTRYLATLSRSLKRYESQDKDLAALAAARKILEIDASSSDASRVVESVAWKIQKASLEKAKKKRKALPFLKRAESAFGAFVADTEKLLKLAHAKKDALGVLQCAKSILALDAQHKEALRLQAEARTNVLKTARALGRPLKEADLAWYKIEGKRSFDGDLVAFNTGVLGVGPMARDVVITCEIKARRPRFKFGWGAQNSWGSPAGEDERFDGTQWVPFAVVATPYVGFWQAGDTVYRPDGCGYTGRLIVYPEGPVEIRGVRVFTLRK